MGIQELRRGGRGVQVMVEDPEAGGTNGCAALNGEGLLGGVGAAGDPKRATASTLELNANIDATYSLSTLPGWGDRRTS